MKSYIQPAIEIQTIQANAIICVSVTKVTSNVVVLKDAYVGTNDAR